MKLAELHWPQVEKLDRDKIVAGVLGMPSASSPEVGEKLYQGALDALEKAIRFLQSHP